jgi:hypothetical protein
MKEIPLHIKEKIDKLTDELKKVYELAEESWEGCDGCDENDKNFFINGFRIGYNAAKPDEILDEDIKRKIKREYLYSNYNEKRLMIEGAMWYKEQLKQNK